VAKAARVEPITEVRAFLEANGSVLMSADDLAKRTGLSIGEVNRALLTLHRDGQVRVDSHAQLWTNIGLQLAAATG